MVRIPLHQIHESLWLSDACGSKADAGGIGAWTGWKGRYLWFHLKITAEELFDLFEVNDASKLTSTLELLANLVAAHLWAPRGLPTIFKSNSDSMVALYSLNKNKSNSKPLQKVLKVYCWLALWREWWPAIEFIQGIKNIWADGCSRLHLAGYEWVLDEFDSTDKEVVDGKMIREMLSLPSENSELFIQSVEKLNQVFEN